MINGQLISGITETDRQAIIARNAYVQCRGYRKQGIFRAVATQCSLSRIVPLRLQNSGSRLMIYRLQYGKTLQSFAVSSILVMSMPPI